MLPAAFKEALNGNDVPGAMAQLLGYSNDEQRLQATGCIPWSYAELAHMAGEQLNRDAFAPLGAPCTDLTHEAAPREAPART